MKLVLPLAVLMTFPAAANAACIDVAGAKRLSFTGTLEHKIFPGPPNYESVAAGDQPEPTYLLKLTKPICITDGGEFADPAKRFDTIHVFTDKKALLQQLTSAIGKSLTVTGPGFAAHTGHHHAPLVLQADKLSRE